MNIDPKPTVPPGADMLVSALGYGMWFVIFVCIAAAVFAVGRLAWSGVTGEPLANPVKGVVVPIVAAALAGAIAGIVLAVIN